MGSSDAKKQLTDVKAEYALSKKSKGRTPPGKTTGQQRPQPDKTKKP